MTNTSDYHTKGNRRRRQSCVDQLVFNKIVHKEYYYRYISTKTSLASTSLSLRNYYQQNLMAQLAHLMTFTVCFCFITFLIFITLVTQINISHAPVNIYSSTDRWTEGEQQQIIFNLVKHHALRCPFLPKFTLPILMCA